MTKAYKPNIKIVKTKSPRQSTSPDCSHCSDIFLYERWPEWQYRKHQSFSVNVKNQEPEKIQVYSQLQDIKKKISSRGTADIALKRYEKMAQSYQVSIHVHSRHLLQQMTGNSFSTVQYLNMVLNNKTSRLFLEFDWCEYTFELFKTMADSVT